MATKITRPVLCFGFIISLTAPPASAAEYGPDRSSDYQPSFSCEAARATIEQLICNNKHLAVLDRALAEGLQQLLETKGVGRQLELAEQRAWLRQRLVTCKIPQRGMSLADGIDAVDCLEDLYRFRIPLLGAKYWRLADKPLRRELTGSGIELVEPLAIGKRTLKGTVSAADVEGMLDEPATNLLELQLAPPNGDDFDKWKTVHTCREWMQLHKDGWNPEDSFNIYRDNAFVAACGPLAAISVGQAAKVSYLPEHGAGDIRLYSSLIAGFLGDVPAPFAKMGVSLGDAEADTNDPLAIYRGPRFYQEVEPAEQTQAKHDIVLTTEAVAEYQVRFDYGDTGNGLQVLARGDFNGDGIEDFLVYHSDSAINGTAVIGELAVYTRLTDHSPIEQICKLEYDSLTCKKREQ